MSDEDPRQVLLHPALVPHFEAWLAGRGLEMHCIGTLSEDDLPTWVVSPTDERLSLARTIAEHYERDADRRRQEDTT